MYRLGYGHRHRGATWHDEDHEVVWLLGYAQHAFEDAGDAFPFFKDLDAEDRLLPSPRDYEALFRDRDSRLTEVVSYEAQALLQLARSNPDEEQRGLIGGQLGVGVAVVVVDPLEEVFIAVKTAGLEPESLTILLAAFLPDRDYEDFETIYSMPGRQLETDELGFRSLLD